MRKKENSGFRHSKFADRYHRAPEVSGATVCGLLLISAAGTALAQAQQSPPESKTDAPPPTQIQEIVVTANKRAETLLKAPVAVSVLPVETLKNAGVVGIQDLNAIAPNTNVRSIGVDNGLQFSIRGVTNSDFNTTANPAVSTYIDGVYVGKTTGLVGSLFDLERVEVLRGPQGTLYGRNSTGGNVNIYTASPKRKFGASADVAYGSYGDVQSNAMVNVPVSDTLAIRGAITTHRSDGYFDTAGTTAKNLGAADEYAGRLTALWTPTDAFRWRLSFDAYTNRGTPWVDQQTAPDGTPMLGGSPYKQPIGTRQQTLLEPMLNITNKMLRSKMDWTLSENVSLTYTAGYQRVKSVTETVVLDSPFQRITPSDTHNHELVASVDLDSLHNLAGVSYLHQYGHDAHHQAAFVNTPFDMLAMFTGKDLTKAWGVFDQLTYDLTKDLRLTGGARYTRETFSIIDNIATFCPYSEYPLGSFNLTTIWRRQFELPGCTTVPNLNAGRSTGSASSSSPTYLLRLEQDLSNRTSNYFSVSTGFKAGGLNLGANVSAERFGFKPEKVINYEYGLKTRLFENRVGINAALFYSKYDDIQVTQLPRGELSTITTNAAGARMYGLELEGQWKVNANTRLSGFFNYLNATYVSYLDAVDELTGQVVPSLNGNYQPFSPKFSGRIQLNHDISMDTGGRWEFMGSIYGQSTSYLRPFNLSADRVASHTKSDASVSYVFPGEHFTATAFVHNLENKAVRNGGSPFVGQYLSSYSPPRTFGIRLNYKL